MTDWIEWNGGECPIKSDKTLLELKLADGEIIGPECEAFQWWNMVKGVIAYRIIEDHEPMTHTREEITAQIEALRKQLDAMPIVSRVVWGAAGTNYFTHEEVVETINGVPHIHGVAMKEVGK